MSLISWFAIRSGGISIILLLALCVWVLLNQRAIQRTHHTQHYERRNPTNGVSKPLFSYYSLLIHIFVIIFPLRACWAIWELTGNLQQATLKARKNCISMTPRPKWKVSSSISLSSTDTSVSQISLSRTSSEKGDSWDSATESEDDLDPVVHVILIPNYKECFDGLSETLDVLASHPQAKYSYHVSIFFAGD
jgi:hypothetical protein